MDRVCSRCGCASFHYDRSRMRMACDLCGAALSDPQQDQQRMQHDRTCFQAANHLAAGNWAQAIALLRPLMCQYPTEKQLYLMVLRAATQDFGDISMDNAANRAAAAEAWDKLVRLNGVTDEMIRYGRQRYENHRAALHRQRTAILAWLFAAAFCSVLAGVFFGAERCLVAVLFTGGLVCCLRRVFRSQPVRVIKQLTRAAPDFRRNPFL